ncbi:hypothetical protein KFK09_011785 [Dendrobium nobile]|uniref:Retrovirus-related Pol polyprotein from transposon TNT 1-94 n=1 Tax=Dendrobium nobile TaxID=94219 RepID=A0A8T3BFV9_DENNO|nr:hypothetical protein KFK09_011785 [Dendrobium nobile]
MGDQELTTSLPPSSPNTTDHSSFTDLPIPTSLKFLISNIKNLLPHPLTVENYAIWRLQILQQFTATRFAGHLTGKIAPPATDNIKESERWQLVDNNLISALFATISLPILPYVITSTTAQEVWTILERRLQPTSRSRVIQLKNELHHVQMKDQTMQQHLSHIKQLVDSIAASGSKVEPEDIVLYILNGLPTTYNSFKTAIRTSSLPADLDDLYSLLCIEELHINQDLLKESTTNPNLTALYTFSQNPNRGRSNKRNFKNNSSNPRPPNTI